ncbi:hypothetical protein ACFWUP_18215 [Nocardia sp. NPDC058658]|uniref:DUF7373 family lipoprotein n=1 Tax=Nocardia sp. NPDC058658 TaxID=3346580 RepID=UPI003665E1A3
MTPVNLERLNLGGYSAEPTQYELPDTAKPADVRLIEANRMLNFMVTATDVDPDLTVALAVETYADPGGPFKTPALPEKYRPVMADNKLIAGTYFARTDGNKRTPQKLIAAIYRFPTDQAARAAAEQMDRISYEGEESRRPVRLDGHPDIKASIKDDLSAIAVATRGPYVTLINYGASQPDQTSVTKTLEKGVADQLAKLDQLKPTPLEDILDTPIDPDGIMRRALPKSPTYSDPFTSELDFHAYSPAGELAFERNQALMKAAFAESGVDLVGRRYSVVYRTKDLASAFHLQSALVTLGHNDERIESPPGLADTRCIRLYEVDEIRHYQAMCAVVHGRYVGVVVAPQKLAGKVDPTLYERAAAQYAVLAKSE